MAQCKNCGKKGIFLKVNSKGFCENCEKSPNVILNNTLGMNDEEKFALYERIIIQEKRPDVALFHYYTLCRYYLKKKRYDSAWSLTNEMTMKFYSDSDVAFIREIQFDILKSEKRHLADAVMHLSVSKILYSRTNQKEKYSKEEFKKRIESILPCLNWDNTIVNGIIKLIDSEISANQFSEITFKKKYYEYLDSVSDKIDKNIKLAEEKADNELKAIEEKVNSKQVRIPKYDVTVRDELRQHIIDNKNRIKELAATDGNGYDEYMKAVSLSKEGNLKDALIYYYVSVKKKFDAPALYNELSKLLHKNGLFKEEIEILDTALKSINFNQEFRYNNEFVEKKFMVIRVIEKENENKA